MDIKAKLGDPETPPLTDGDRKVLDQDLANREAARKVRDDPTSDKATVSKAKGDVNKASEDLGEHGADAAIKSKFPGSKTEFEGHGSGTLDRVYKDGDRYIVVEAKGGSAELGSREVAGGKRAQQGAREYLDSILDSMEKKGGEAKQTAVELRQALREDKVDYYKATTRIGEKKGVPYVRPTTLQKFQISS